MKKKIKILQANTGLVAGGAERLISDMVPLLEKSGMDLELLLLEDKGNNIRWRLVKATNEIVDNAIEPMDYMPSIDYAVIYDRDAMTLRFISEDMNVLSGVVAQVYTVGGRLLYTFMADRVQSVADLPSGTYIVRWMLGDAAYDVKFKK